MFVAASLLGVTCAQAQQPSARPNILWITSEDNGPQLGAYGDTYATTPSLDTLAARGLRYLHAWSTAPVCAPARTAIITGLYPSSTGAEHMRSTVTLPPGFRMFPQFLREQGYYATNNSKEDYNLEKPGLVWDDSSPTAHWRNRTAGQPFFAVFNTTVSHESQVRVRPHVPVHDPAEAPIPAYHPDVPAVRQDWAQYYDKLTEMDRFVGERLQELEAAGLSDDTIVFYYGDHGPGMPRSKRWPYNSGLQVPLIVVVPDRFEALAPEGYEPAGSSDRLVSFVDLAPTVLSLAGIEPPGWMQGRAFMGRFAAAAPRYQFGLRGRMDERYDLVRSVSDGRWVYLRNYMPHRIYGQYLDYMFQTPTTRVWYEMFAQGLLSAPETYFWESKPFEELYDLQVDPDEIRNLAAHPGRAPVRDRLRAALRAHLLETHDLGFLPEYEMRRLSASSSPWALGQSPDAYDVRAVLAMAEAASDPGEPVSVLEQGLRQEDAAVRYWAATGYLIRGGDAVTGAERSLTTMLGDPEPGPRIAAAEALARYGSAEARERAIDALVGLARLDREGLYVTMLALNALAHVSNLSPQVKRELQAAPQKDPSISPREDFYVARLTEAIVEELPHPAASPP
jgi:arylsulfatase A-like enzyme